MRHIFSFLFICIILPAAGQSIASANLRHWYEPLSEKNFNCRVANEKDSIAVYFHYDTSRFDIKWERRDSYGQASGETIPNWQNLHMGNGRLVVAKPPKPWLLLAVLTNRNNREAAYYFKVIEAAYPFDGLVLVNNKPLFQPYSNTKVPVTFSHTAADRLYAFHYKDDFPIASPPFAEKEGKVAPIMDVDSVFQFDRANPVVFKKEGLYLVQADTNASKGIPLWIGNNAFPRMTRIDDLAAAMIFISTKEEYTSLMATGPEKAKFDKVVLGITRDKARAKNLIRKYFRRIELANTFFTSYKEGWKTDRGMIYIIFGIPDIVSRTSDNEVWTYKNISTRFTFTRTPSLYDPNNYVLVRDAKYMNTWYYTIDLWRKDQIDDSEDN